MNATAPPRPPSERVRDTLRRLGGDVDAWVATSSADGVPHLVPLSFLWDGDTLLFATRHTSPTGRNLARGVATVGLGHTRDVVMVHGLVETLDLGAVPPEVADAFTVRTGFDPRHDPGNRFHRLRPRRIRAWREENELAGRDVMRDGRWTAAG